MEDLINSTWPDFKVDRADIVSEFYDLEVMFKSAEIKRSTSLFSRKMNPYVVSIQKEPLV